MTHLIKKSIKALSMILTIALLLIIPLNVNADDENYNKNLDRVYDECDLLTISEIAKLNDKIDRLVDKYECDVAIAFVDTIGYKTITEYADDYFDYGGAYFADTNYQSNNTANGYGYGSEMSGLVLVVSMSEREWAISTKGDAIGYFTDYGCDFIGEKVQEKLTNADYEGACNTYLQYVDKFLDEAINNGTPYDVTHRYTTAFERVFAIIVCFLIGAVIAGISVGSMYSKMKKANKVVSASTYAFDRTLDLSKSQDQFVTTHTTRTVRNTESSTRSGGGSSIHMGSSGSSHGGSHGHF